MGILADAVVQNASLMLQLAEAQMKGIEPGTFSRFAPGAGGHRVVSNHPSFVLGHLSIYPRRVLEIGGIDPSPAAVTDAYVELYKAGAECKDDPTGTIYPPMAEVVDRFVKGHRAVIESFGRVPDEKLAVMNPDEARRVRFPTLFMQCQFLLGSHAMLHLGQLSAWRRMMGLGSAV